MSTEPKGGSEVIPPPPGSPRWAVARHLHKLTAPRGEDTDADWRGMSNMRRDMYLDEADVLIALARGERVGEVFDEPR